MQAALPKRLGIMADDVRREAIRKRVEAARRDQSDREHKRALVDAAILAAQGSGRRTVDVDQHTKHNLLLHGVQQPNDQGEQHKPYYPMPESFTDPTKDHTAAAIALERVGDIRGMVRAFEAAYEFNPNPHHTGLNLGYAYLNIGQWERAASLLHAAHRHSPENEQIALNFQKCMQLVHQQRAEQETLQVQEKLIRPPFANISVCDGTSVVVDAQTLQCSVDLDVCVREAEEDGDRRAEQGHRGKM